MLSTFCLSFPPIQIKRYYKFKVKHSDIFEDLVPSRETNIFKQNILVVFPNRDQLGRRILLLELGSEYKSSSVCWLYVVIVHRFNVSEIHFISERWKHKEVTLDEVFKGCVVFLEAAMLEPETQVHGAVVIFDMDGLSLQQTWQFTPQFAKRIVDWLQDSVPMRIKGIYIINQPKLFNIVFALFKPFLREKLRNRIIFMGSDMNSLHKYISPKFLPPAYGGVSTVPRVNGDQWYDLLLQCDREYKAINSYGYNKNKPAKKWERDAERKRMWKVSRSD